MTFAFLCVNNYGRLFITRLIKKQNDGFGIEYQQISWLQKTIICSATIPTSLWFPIFLLQLYEQTRMVLDISRMNVEKLMTRGLEFEMKDLLKSKEDD